MPEHKNPSGQTPREGGSGNKKAGGWSDELARLLTGGSTAGTPRTPSELEVMLVRVVSAVVTLVADRFLLDAHSPHRIDDPYIQGMLEDDGSLHLEVPSNEFLHHPLLPDQVSQLLELGWQAPTEGLPNFWRILTPAQIVPGPVAQFLVRTLLEVYGASSDDDFTLSPLDLAAVALPADDSITLLPPAPDAPGGPLARAPHWWPPTFYAAYLADAALILIDATSFVWIGPAGAEDELADAIRRADELHSNPFDPDTPHPLGQARKLDRYRVAVLPTVPDQPLPVEVPADLDPVSVLAAFRPDLEHLAMYRFPGNEITWVTVDPADRTAAALALLAATPTPELWQRALEVGLPGVETLTMTHPDARIRALLDADLALALDLADRPANRQPVTLQLAMAENPATSQPNLLALADSGEPAVRARVAANPTTHERTRERLSRDADDTVAIEALLHLTPTRRHTLLPNLQPDRVAALLNDSRLPRREAGDISRAVDLTQATALLTDPRTRADALGLLPAELLPDAVHRLTTSQAMTLLHDPRLTPTSVQTLLPLLAEHQAVNAVEDDTIRARGWHLPLAAIHPAARARLAARPDTPPEYVLALLTDDHAVVRAAALRNPAAPAWLALRIAQATPDAPALKALDERADIDSTALTVLVSDAFDAAEDPTARLALVGLRAVTQPLLRRAVQDDPSTWVVAAALENPNCPASLIRSHAADPDMMIRWAALRSAQDRGIRVGLPALRLAATNPFHNRPYAPFDVLESPAHAVIDLAEQMLERELALTIARCRDVEPARSDRSHTCHKIVSSQPDDPGQWQVPEPWAGNLTLARIVFIASNPSISLAGDLPGDDVAEDYPRGAWDDDSITDFVVNRFAGRWASADSRFRRTDGTLSPRPVVFWNGVRGRASELLDRTAHPASDYVMTEVVHCKSKGELGVADASSWCAGRHLDNVLAATNAPVIVILGAKARDYLVPLWRLPATFGQPSSVGIDEDNNLAIRTLGGRDRHIAYLWHPSGMTGPKTFAGAYPSRLTELKNLITAAGPDNRTWLE